jgi:hypothetical protein
MKRIDLFSIASAIGLISTAAFAQVFPNFDVGKAMEIAGQKVFADRCAVCRRTEGGRASLRSEPQRRCRATRRIRSGISLFRCPEEVRADLDGGQSARLDRRSIAHGPGHTHAARIAQ